MLLRVGYVNPIKRSASCALLARFRRIFPNATEINPERESLLSEDDSKNEFNGKVLEILRVRNRFVNEDSTEHSSGGFRDLAFKIKIGFQVLVVVLQSPLKVVSFRPVTVLTHCLKESSSGEPRFVPVYAPLHERLAFFISHSIDAAGNSGMIRPSELSSASFRFTTK